jgi:hypothetical protein
MLDSKPLTPTLSQDGAQKIDDSVVQEVVKDYYAAAVSSADAARTRAQNGYTIASAIAAAIVAAGVFGGIDDARTLVKIIGVLALLAWLTVAGLFMYAVAGNVRGLETGEQSDASSFVRVVIGNVREVRGAINARSQAAQIATVFAIILTVAGIAIALFWPPTSKFNGTISLSPIGVKQVDILCGTHVPKRILVSLSASDLDNTFVPIQLMGRACNGGSIIHLRKSSIIAISESTN